MTLKNKVCWLGIDWRIKTWMMCRDMRPVAKKIPECYTAIPAGEKFAGLNSILYLYTVKSYAENSEGDTEAALDAGFDVHYIPIVQF